MIVVTGAAGFIGSCLVSHLSSLGMGNLVLVDDFSHPEKQKNLASKSILQKIPRDQFINSWFAENAGEISQVFHLGARTDTTEQDTALFDRLNLNYSKSIWKVCTNYQIPLVYASSAATYGGGEFGYLDSHDLPSQLVPLNPYGRSKNDFDIWALGQKKMPPFWAGLKFFNVYGPNEYHKGRMASVILHTFRQIQKTGSMKLFRSHRAEVADGQQKRDFVYVKDVVSVIAYLMKTAPENGLYNLGTGTARSFYDLAASTFIAMGLTPKIAYIDTPVDIRDTYQYFTEAKMDKLLAAGYTKEFYSLEDGVMEYVSEYLKEQKYYS